MKNELNIQFSKKVFAPYKIAVFNLEGRKVYENQSLKNNLKLQLNNLKSGIYLLKINNTTMHVTKHIVVK